MNALTCLVRRGFRDKGSHRPTPSSRQPMEPRLSVSPSHANRLLRKGVLEDADLERLTA